MVTILNFSAARSELSNDSLNFSFLEEKICELEIKHDQLEVVQTRLKAKTENAELEARKAEAKLAEQAKFHAQLQIQLQFRLQAANQRAA